MKKTGHLGNTRSADASSMMRWLALTLLCIVSLTAAVWSQGPPQGQPGGAGGRGIQADPEHPIMPIGTQAPDFALPGVDGKIHKLSDYAGARLLAILFECNHCPVSQVYEGRVKKLYEDYRGKGVALVAINPNNPKSVRLNELGYTDMEDSLPEMKIRAENRRITWPYLYDGETQVFSTKLGVVATPHIYIFDQKRKLRYQGRIDDNMVESLVKSQDARNALNALLAGKPVPVENTRSFGCSTKWLSKATGEGSREEEMAKIQSEPVKLEMAGVDELKELRGGEPGMVLVVSFWSTNCSACPDTFHDLETTYRMYRQRMFDFVTVSTDPPDQKAAVMAFLQKQYASSPNLQLATTDQKGLQAFSGTQSKLGSPFTMVISPEGKVLYQKEGKLDLLQMRRIILANMEDTGGFPGNRAYWAEK